MRAELEASPFARSILDAIVPCPHGRDEYLLKSETYYHACCRAGCWVRTSCLWTWLRRLPRAAAVAVLAHTEHLVH